MIEERGGGGVNVEGRRCIWRSLTSLRRAGARAGLAEVHETDLGAAGAVGGSPARALFVGRLCSVESV
jgi:hypothetical protein